jgi:predicted dehydrogenase
MSSKLRGGVIGCGQVANLQHLPNLRNLRDIDLVAVCDRNLILAKKTAKKFHINRVYKNFQSMLELEDLDFVDICTPTFSHAILAIKAFRMGIHVIVEKPMALNLKEADEMIRVSHQNNLQLCIVHNFLFNPIIRRAKHLIESGAIGKIINVEVKTFDVINNELMNPDNWRHKLPNGALFEFAPHGVYLAQLFLDSIHSFKASLNKCIEFPWILFDKLKIKLKTEEAEGLIEVSINSPKLTLSVDIYGTKKNLHCNLNSYLNRINRRLNRIIKPLFPTAAGFLYFGEHRFILSQFVKSIQNKSRPPITGEEGREVLKLLCNIRKKPNFH